MTALFLFFVLLNIVSIVANVGALVTHLKARKKATQNRQTVWTEAYGLGRDQGEEIGVKRGYRLAMKHCANTALGHPPPQEEIP